MAVNDSGVDFARGEKVIYSSSSSEDSTDDEDEEEEDESSKLQMNGSLQNTNIKHSPKYKAKFVL